MAPIVQRPKALTKILVQDPTDPESVADAVHRVQDQMLAVLNPTLRNPITASPPTITGSRGGNAALASLLTALATLGLIKDGTS